jgi:hypothetical protein
MRKNTQGGDYSTHHRHHSQTPAQASNTIHAQIHTQQQHHTLFAQDKAFRQAIQASQAAQPQVRGPN